MNLDRATWRDDGHLTGHAASAAADWQLNDAGALKHLETCNQCLRAVGDAALATTAVARMLHALRREDAAWAMTTRRPRWRPSPLAALAASAVMVALAFVTGRLSAPGVAASTPVPMAHALGTTAGPHLRLRPPELAAPVFSSSAADCLDLTVPR
jgi:hypothetical protein